VSGVERGVGLPLRVEHAPVPPGDVDATLCDVARAERELGFRAEIGLDEGLASVVAWLRARDASLATGAALHASSTSPV
jgi:nucleoside-diphosphate-sugar epimerase